VKEEAANDVSAAPVLVDGVGVGVGMRLIVPSQ
jgi:hypothetical protein